MSSGDNYVADGPAQIGWSTGMERLEVSLPHQCGEWIIGDIDHVRVMIADLTALLPEFEHPEKYRHPHPSHEHGDIGHDARLSCSSFWPASSPSLSRIST